MKSARIGGTSVICAFVLALLTYASPVAAQTGQLKGKVVDGQNKPVADAKIVLEAVETARKVETKTNSKGEYIQIGLPPGNYNVTATKGDLSQSFPVRIGLDMKEMTFVLKAGGAPADVSKEDAKKNAARVELVKTTFAEGATLTNEGKYDEAIAKFNAVLVDIPKCSDCYNNIGTNYIRKQDWVKAEEAFKKSLELSPDSAEAYSGLATVYNAQQKFKEAQQMSAEATKRMLAAGAAGGAGGGNADGLYNAAVISWNANDFAKAHELLTAAVKSSPTHAEAHFMLGRVLINLGKLGEAATEFETYLKLAPTGPNAKEAQTNFDALKSYRK
jgi:tetratricopeptide (TPR) repeat protein